MKSVPVEKIVRGIELFNDDFVFFGMLLYYNIYIYIYYIQVCWNIFEKLISKEDSGNLFIFHQISIISLME